MPEARRAVAVEAELAEGPLWEVDTETLFWTDIEGRRLHRTQPGGRDEVLLEGIQVTGLALHQDGGLILALATRIATLVDGRLETIAEIPGMAPRTRLNDGVCDPAGRFWTGSMHRGLARDRGCLYVAEPQSGVRIVRQSVSLANGIDWSADGRVMYFVDSLSGVIERIDYDLELGRPGTSSTFIRVEDFSDDPGHLVVPDGLCVDAEDCVWVAVHGAGEVRRYSPGGEALETVTLPLPGVTSCAFGGPDLRTLYITAARASADLPGGVFAIRTSCEGRLPYRYQG